jgi:hypothetical protein
MDKESSEVIDFQYDSIKRILISMLFLTIIILGILLIMLNHNIFTVLFGLLMIVIGSVRLFDILFFKKLIINSDFLIKEWFLFGAKTINMKNLRVNVSKRMWTGTIFFNNVEATYFSNFLMRFEIFPIGNDGFRKIKNILIEKKIIKGDEYEWNY